MSSTITLQQQAAAVERAAVNLRGHCDNIAGLVAKGLRPQHELDMLRSWVPALNEAAKTLAVLAEGYAAIRESRATGWSGGPS